jgi:hypothetical protein
MQQFREVLNKIHNYISSKSEIGESELKELWNELSDAISNIEENKRITPDLFCINCGNREEKLDNCKDCINFDRWEVRR